MEENTQTTPALEKAKQRVKEMRENGTYRSNIDPIEKLSRHPTSLRRAIDAKCFDCEGRNADPNVKKRIGTCPITSCPLWNVRPYQRYANTIQHPELLHNQPKIEIDEDDA